MAVDRNAEKARAPLVLADREQRAPERRAQQRRHDRDGESKKKQHEIIESAIVVQDVELGKAEIDRQAMPARQTVVAAGDACSSDRR